MIKNIKQLLLFLVFASSGAACSNNGEREKVYENPKNKVYLQKDTLNVATMKDTLIIYQGVCRGCAYENTDFDIKDSMGITEKYSTRTFDNNPPEMNGGSISKHILLVPKKTGRTIIKLYEYGPARGQYPPGGAADTVFKHFEVEIKN